MIEEAMRAGEYPVLASHYDVWLTMRSDERFLAGLGLVLNGALAATKVRRPR